VASRVFASSRLDGELVTDPYTPAPSGTLIVLMTD
jgi:hypothetical protein